MLKDLKHLIYFEKLLENSNNELIQQAKSEGRLAVGYTCFHMPEVLLNLDKCFSVRLRAPKTGSMDIATYYMSNYTCEYCRALLERAIEGGLNFLDALAGVDACAEMNRCTENIELVADLPGEKFFVTHADIPYKVCLLYTSPTCPPGGPRPPGGCGRRAERFRCKTCCRNGTAAGAAPGFWAGSLRPASPQTPRNGQNL